MSQKSSSILRNPIVKNVASVGAIQAIGMLLPLLTIPYLLQVLGADGFALINVALAVVTYFVVFVDYGFNLMGTRLVTLHKDEPIRLNQIFSNMLYAQLLLTLIAIGIFSIVVFSVPQYRENSMLFLSTFGIVVGATLLPTWFFQGKEILKSLHLIILFGRALYTLAIFTLVTQASDVLWVPIFNSSTTILIGIIGLLYVMQTNKLRFTAWRFTEISAFLKEGWNLFVSALCSTSIQQLPIIILAFFASPIIVGYYAFADKLMLVFRVSIQLLSSILYPRIISVSKTSTQKLKQFLTKVRSAGSILFIAGGVLLFLTPFLLKNYLPQYYNPALSGVLKVWSILPLVVFLKITFQQVLLAYDFTKAFAQKMLWAAFINVFLLLILTLYYGYLGTAAAVVLTEVFLIFVLWAKGNLLLSKFK